MIGLDYFSADSVNVLFYGSGKLQQYTCSALACTKKNHTLTGSGGEYNAVTLSDTHLIVAYYQHIFKFDKDTGNILTYGKTTSSTYPLSMVYDSSYSGTLNGVLIVLYSSMSTSS